MELKFDIEKKNSSIIKVIGVGGGGSNAVNHMYKQGIKGVDFVIFNTDAQALEQSPVPFKVQLGAELTEGRGAGSLPEVGKNAALETEEEIRKILSNNTKMVFITAGMGGGTGTGAAPIIARIARELGILTVGIVTTPFAFEGKKRWSRATDGINQLNQEVDTSLVISNEKLKEMHGNLPISSAFAHADNILATAAKGIAEIITVPGSLNVDFEDVRTVMAKSGKAILGSASAEGENRAQESVEKALHSPLLSENDIRGAKYILLNITSGTKEILMDEITIITDFIQNEVGDDTDIIWGHCYDQSIGEKISVTIIATSFENKEYMSDKSGSVKKVIGTLDEKETDENGYDKKTDKQMHIDFNSNKENGETDNITSYEKTPEKKQNGVNQEDRIDRLKSLSYSLKTTKGIEDMEREPAFKRKNIKLRDVPHSSESGISRFTLSDDVDSDEDGKKKPEIKKTNSFLHDNVD